MRSLKKRIEVDTMEISYCLIPRNNEKVKIECALCERKPPVILEGEIIEGNFSFFIYWCYNCLKKLLEKEEIRVKRNA